MSLLIYPTKQKRTLRKNLCELGVLVGDETKYV